ncbi:MAG: DUF58 domain-containing protein [Cyanobacteria bacterium]|nr:DUF58 domain-containing protein [Cyanobacteriota bacterium]
MPRKPVSKIDKNESKWAHFLQAASCTLWDPAAYIDEKIAGFHLDKGLMQSDSVAVWAERLRWRWQHNILQSPDSGPHNLRLSGSGLDYHRLREYVPGDDVRAIDWLVYARTQALHVRETQAERLNTVWLVLDCSASMEFGARRSKLDWSLDLALITAESAFQSGFRVGLLAYRMGKDPLILPPHSSRDAVWILFERLRIWLKEEKNEGIGSEAEKVFQETEKCFWETASRLIKPQHWVVVWSDFLGFPEDLKPMFHGLCRRSTVLAAWMRDAREVIFSKAASQFGPGVWESWTFFDSELNKSQQIPWPLSAGELAACQHQLDKTHQQTASFLQGCQGVLPIVLPASDNQLLNEDDSRDQVYYQWAQYWQRIQMGRVNGVDIGVNAPEVTFL